MGLRHLVAAVAITLATGAGVVFGEAEARKPEGAAAGDAGQQVQPPVGRRDPGSLRETRGKVQDVDKGRNQVTVERSDQEPVTLEVDKSTTIFIDGRTGTLDEIGAGEEVRASFERKQGSNRAQWIEVSKKARRPPQTRETLPEVPETPGTPPAPSPR